MKKYRKRPIEIEAVQLSWATWSEVCNLLQDVLGPENQAWHILEAEASDTCGEPGPDYIALRVFTMHGETAVVRHGDWIIPDAIPGTFYPCKPDVFANTYEVID